MKRGRKPAAIGLQPQPELNHEQVAADAAAADELARIERGYAADRDRANQLHGQLMLVGALRKFSAAAEIKVLVDIRDNNLFKHLHIIQCEIGFRPAENFVEFCEKGIGVQASIIYERIQNYELLGDAYDDFQKLGLDRKHFRALRRLPDDAREAVIDGTAVDLSDPEEVKAYIEERDERAAKERRKLEKRIENLQADNEAKDRVIENEKRRTTELETKIHRRKKLPELELTEIQLGELALEATQVIGAMSLFRDKLSEIMTRDEPPPVLTDHACNMLTFMAQEILAIQSHFAMPIKLEQEMDPHYVTKLVQQHARREQQS